MILLCHISEWSCCVTLVNDLAVSHWWMILLCHIGESSCWYHEWSNWCWWFLGSEQEKLSSTQMSIPHFKCNQIFCNPIPHINNSLHAMNHILLARYVAISGSPCHAWHTTQSSAKRCVVEVMLSGKLCMTKAVITVAWDTPEANLAPCDCAPSRMIVWACWDPGWDPCKLYVWLSRWWTSLSLLGSRPNLCTPVKVMVKSELAGIQAGIHANSMYGSPVMDKFELAGIQSNSMHPSPGDGQVWACWDPGWDPGLLYTPLTRWWSSLSLLGSRLGSRPTLYTPLQVMVKSELAGIQTGI